MGLSQPEFDQRRYLKRACLIVGIIIVGLAMVWARAFYGSMKAYRQGEMHLEAHQYVKAITFFDRALHWFTPFNPYPRRSAQCLWEIGGRAEQNGDIRLALIAYRTIRRGFWAARSFYAPGRAWIQKCDVQISKLTGVDQADRSASGSPSRLGDSKKAKDVSTFWSIILEIGFLGWVGSILALIMFACKSGRKATFRASQTLIWGGIATIFFALWIIAMVRA
jgi:hypothetical protein